MMTPLSFASFTRDAQLQSLCNVSMFPKIQRDCFLLVRATFILLMSARNPIPLGLIEPGEALTVVNAIPNFKPSVANFFPLSLADTVFSHALTSDRQ